MHLTSLLAASLAGTAAASSFGALQETEPQGLCDENVQQYAGYANLTTGDKHYFYWAFESRNDPATDPVILWMTGGPGCSSEVALFGENGPCTVNADGKTTTPNAFSWNNNATLIYIDQPAGTGYSYGKGMDKDEAGVAADMYDFLQIWFEQHPKFADRDFFAVGESYAGHYVPAVTHQIWANNKNLPAGASKINLKGVSVGNGLTAPSIQYNYYKDMIVSTNDHKAAVGSVVHKAMEVATPLCVDAIEACQRNTTGACLGATEVCNAGLLMPYQLTGMNVYDMRIKCAKPPLCYDFSNVGTYLEQPEVMAQLGVTGKKWSSCNHAVALAFELDGDWMKNFNNRIPDMLNDGIPVLIYAGDQDFICNWLGNQAWTRELEWDHSAEFNASAVTNWTVAGEAAGTKQQANGFTFLRVFDAGHMVPRDQPANALAMINAFTSNTI